MTSKKSNLEHYRNMLKQPWGKIQYEITFAQLAHLEGKKILDFGSGFGLVSEFLSRKNQVISVEPNEEMLYANSSTSYEKLWGSIDQLVRFTDKSFDLVLCHNVLEYIDPNDRKDYLLEFKRILKDDAKTAATGLKKLAKLVADIAYAQDRDVLLAGGVFQNKTLLENVILILKQKSKKYYINKYFSANDSSIAIGQIAFALIYIKVF